MGVLGGVAASYERVTPVQALGAFVPLLPFKKISRERMITLLVRFDNRLRWGAYRGTSLIRNSAPLRPYRRPMPRVLGRS